MRIRLLSLVSIVGMAVLLVSSVSQAEPPAAGAKEREPAKFKVHAGGALPFHVVDFLTGKHAAHCGCPSVMINNHGGRGLVIWTKGLNEGALHLATEADKRWLNGGKKQGYLVVFDLPDEKVQAQFKKGTFTHLSAGYPRHTSEVQFRNYEIDKTAQQFVYLVEAKEIKQMWTLQAGELTREKQQEILQAMGKHFGE